MTRLATFLLMCLSASVSAHCFEEAAQQYQVSAELLRAIAIVESGNNPSAMNFTHRDRTSSHDIGLLQVNSRWLPTLSKHGITEEHLRSDACLNAKVGAWILSDTLRRHGNDWNGVGAYNAACTQLKGSACTEARNRYAWKVYRAMTRESGTALSARTPRTPSDRIAVLTIAPGPSGFNNKSDTEAD